MNEASLHSVNQNSTLSLFLCGFKIALDYIRVKNNLPNNLPKHLLNNFKALIFITDKPTKKRVNSVFSGRKIQILN